MDSEILWSMGEAIILSQETDVSPAIPEATSSSVLFTYSLHNFKYKAQRRGVCSLFFIWDYSLVARSLHSHTLPIRPSLHHHKNNFKTTTSNPIRKGTRSARLLAASSKYADATSICSSLPPGLYPQFALLHLTTAKPSTGARHSALHMVSITASLTRNTQDQQCVTCEPFFFFISPASSRAKLAYPALPLYAPQEPITCRNLARSAVYHPIHFTVSGVQHQSRLLAFPRSAQCRRLYFHLIGWQRDPYEPSDKDTHALSMKSALYLFSSRTRGVKRAYIYTWVYERILWL